MTDVLLGKLTDLKVDGKRIGFIIKGCGTIEMTSPSNELDRLCEAVVKPLAKELGVKPDVEIIRNLEVI